jgi:hypothetical protein
MAVQKVVQGDSGTLLKFTILDQNGKVVDLTDATEVKLIIERSDATVIRGGTFVTINDATAGLVSYTTYSNDFPTGNDTVYLKLYVYYSDASHFITPKAIPINVVAQTNNITGNDLPFNNPSYVQKTGDTMTGDLTMDFNIKPYIYQGIQISSKINFNSQTWSEDDNIPQYPSASVLLGSNGALYLEDSEKSSPIATFYDLIPFVKIKEGELFPAPQTMTMPSPSSIVSAQRFSNNDTGWYPSDWASPYDPPIYFNNILNLAAAKTSGSGYGSTIPLANIDPESGNDATEFLNIGDNIYFQNQSRTIVSKTSNSILLNSQATYSGNQEIISRYTSVKISPSLYYAQSWAVEGSILPLLDNSYSLGKTDFRWKEIWTNASGLNTASDYRIKTDIKASILGLDFIKKLNPVSYKFKIGENIDTIKDDGSHEIIKLPGKRTHFGLIAQEVKNSLPEDLDFGGWILTDKNNPESEQALRYEEFISPLIKAVQELSQQVQDLQNEIKVLKGQS